MYRSQVYSQPYWRTVSWKVIIDFYVQWSQNHVFCTRFKCIWVTLVIIHCLKSHLKKSQSKLGTLPLSSCSRLLLTVFCMFVCFLKQVFEELLLDADWSVNAGSWMWLSCSSFFQQFFHCYCPVGFGRRTDPNGDYIRSARDFMKYHIKIETIVWVFVYPYSHFK